MLIDSFSVHRDRVFEATITMSDKQLALLMSLTRNSEDPTARQIHDSIKELLTKNGK